MGQQPSRDKTLSDERMEQLIANTNLTKKEISMALGKFLAKTRFTINDIQLEHRVGLLQMTTNFEELQYNPFRQFICKVFSSDGTGAMTFEDYIDMLSTMHETASFSEKSDAAYRVFDFFGKQVIGYDEVLKGLLIMSVDKAIAPVIAEKVMEQADIDDNGAISLSEFRSILKESPDFMNNFTMRLLPNKDKD